MVRVKTWLASLLALKGVLGCGELPAGHPSEVRPAPITSSARSPTATASAEPEGDRFLAFTTCRHGDRAGGIFLWDAALQDVYALNGALAGLAPIGKQVGGPGNCEQLDQVGPSVFLENKVLFSYGSTIFVYDLATEERIVAATDGRPPSAGGPSPSISSDGKLLAYVSRQGTLVLKPTHPTRATKTRELALIAAEIAALTRGRELLDLDLSGNGRWIVLAIGGTVYLYDVPDRLLTHVAPLDGAALAGFEAGFDEVAINSDGRFIAASMTGKRLLILDRVTQRLDTVPLAALGETLGEDGSPFDPSFEGDGRSLRFETRLGRTFRVWRYDFLNETLRALVIRNAALGESADDTRR